MCRNTTPFKDRRIIPDLLQLVHDLIVQQQKENNAKAAVLPFDEKKPFDLPQLVCKVHHNHTLRDMTLQLMKEEVVTKDFRNGYLL